METVATFEQVDNDVHSYFQIHNPLRSALSYTTEATLSYKSFNNILYVILWNFCEIKCPFCFLSFVFMVISLFKHSCDITPGYVFWLQPGALAANLFRGAAHVLQLQLLIGNVT